MSSLGSMLAFAVSCAAAPAPLADAPEPPAAPAEPSPDAPEPPPAPDEGDGAPPEGDAPDDGGGTESPSEGDAPDDGGTESPPEPEPEPAPREPAQKQPAIEATEPAFINGEVPKVERFLAKQGERVATCVLKHGGLTEADGLLKMQFLVRMRGRAEGVEVLAARGVTEEAQRCAQKRLKNEYVGTPTADPTGVTFTYRLKRRFK